MRGKHVYRCEDAAGNVSVAKICMQEYPRLLHEELSQHGLTPQLLGPVQHFPGDVNLIQMGLLSEDAGWMAPEVFDGGLG